MADVAGRLGTLAMDPAAGVTYVAIAGIQGLKLKVDQEVYDVTDHDSGAWMEHIIGRKQVTISVSGNYDEADAGQVNVITTATIAGTMVTWRYRPRGTGSGLKEYTFTGSVTNCEIDNPNDAASKLTFDIQVTAAVTQANQ